MPNVAELSVTLIDATGAGGGVVTVTSVAPCTPSAVAMTSATPAAVPVTRPAPETVAMVFGLVDHVTVRLITFPPASFTVAVNCSVPLTLIELLTGDTVIEAAVTLLTDTFAVEVRFPDLALIAADPT